MSVKLSQVWKGTLMWPSTAVTGGGDSEAAARLRRWRSGLPGPVWRHAMGASLL